MRSVNPTPLIRGDTIGLVAPSSPLRAGRLEVGQRYLEQLGFKVKVGPHLHDSIRFLAGSDEHRAADIMDFFVDPEVKAIIATAGGYGSQRLLPLLDYAVIAKNPKIIVGFSDTTALQLGLLKKCGLISYTGFTFRDADANPPDALIEQTLFASLTGKAYHSQEGTPVRSGIIEGPLIGGTLSLLTTLMGTPYQPDFKDSILFFEEVWAEPFQVDAMLSHLELAGVFNEVKGIIIGQFQQCIAQHDPESDGTIEQVIHEWSERVNVPCLKDFPYGHGSRRCVLPLGKTVTLDVNARTLTIPGEAP